MIYEYKCDCGNTYEATRSIYDAEVMPTCTDCHKSMNRVFGVGNIKFEGTGFYSTDNPKR